MIDKNKIDDLSFEVIQIAKALLEALEDGNEDEADDVRKELNNVLNKLRINCGSEKTFDRVIHEIKNALTEKDDEETADLINAILGIDEDDEPF